MINCIYIIILLIILFLLINMYEEFDSCKIIKCATGFKVENNTCVVDIVCPTYQKLVNNICTDYNNNEINTIISNFTICSNNLEVNIDNICTPYITEYKFTNCGATGRLGPTIDNCNNSYKDTTLANKISMESSRQGIQIWTVPITGKYLITVAGAGINVGVNCKGVVISSVFTLNINDKNKNISWIVRFT